MPSCHPSTSPKVTVTSISDLARYLPALAHVPWVSIGTWPTPLVGVTALGTEHWWKCEGVSHPLYGGNKVRTLEPWLGHALARRASRLWVIGATGSNQAIATVVHGRRAGIDVGAILFPQVESEWSRENHAALLASGCPLVTLRSVVEVPFAALRLARDGAIVMPPGGANPIGTLGAVTAAYELAEQLDAGLAPPPARIVLAAGSTCTAAGLVAGIALAEHTGAWRHRIPLVHAVRVTPWPVTSHWRIAMLAARTLARVAQLGGPRVPISLRALHARLVVDGSELGPGYGRPTVEGRAAMVAFAHGPRLDGVYSAKAAAAALRLARQGVGPLVFWSSKDATFRGPRTPGSA